MDTNKALAAFHALSQETRLKAFRYLAEAGRDGMPAGKLAKKLGVPHNTLSFHLSQLAHAELVESLRKGRSIVYYANIARLHELTQFLVERCSMVDFLEVAANANAKGKGKKKKTDEQMALF